ncbi:hypothetical protein Hanom_Chr12g01181331 [Helianthus anomalus]
MLDFFLTLKAHEHGLAWCCIQVVYKATNWCHDHLFGKGMSEQSLTDRATIANISPRVQCNHGLLPCRPCHPTVP